MFFQVCIVARRSLGTLSLLLAVGAPLHAQVPVTRPTTQVTPPASPAGAPTGASEAAAQNAASARAGRPVSSQEISELVKNSGLSPDQIRARLRSAGYDPSIADPYLNPSGAASTDPGGAARSNPTAFLTALKELGIVSDLQAGDANNNSVADEVEDLNRPNADRISRGVGGVFGKNIFRRGTSVFDPIAAGPVDASYRLGVGDQLQLLITGAVEYAYQLDIRRDGTVVIPQVGQVALAGLTLEGARVLLRIRAARSYSNLADGSAHLDLTLSKIRTNSIFLIGEVEQPGSYQVSALASAFHALTRAGGPTNSGSFRDVQIRRGGRVIAHMDLYDYLLNGDATQDVRLEQGDVVFVPLNRRAVAATGAVRRPGIYELKDSEGFADLLRFAGGLSPMAATERVQIDRILPAEARGPGLERAIVDITLGQDLKRLETVPLFDGDIIKVFAIGDLRRNSVVIKGEVLQPGMFELLPNMTLAQLIDRAEGLLPWALGDRVKVTRSIPQTGRNEIMSFDLSKDDAKRFVLREFDEITVLDGRLAYPSGRVTVTGAIVRGGSQNYAQGQTLKDVIDQAGGLRREAEHVELFRRRSNREFSDTTSQEFKFEIDSGGGVRQSAQFMMQPEDQVVVRGAPGLRPQRFVQMSGLFKYPGQYAIAEYRDRVSDAVRRAGGLLPTASTENFRLLRSGRTVKIDLTRALEGDKSNDPTMLAGDELFVGADVQTVYVTGEVARPALVLYHRGMSFDDYVAQTGGLKNSADLDRAYIEAPNGDVKRVRSGWFSRTPEVTAGSTITIPAKPEGGDNNWSQRLTTTLQVVSGITSLLIGYLAVKR